MATMVKEKDREKKKSKQKNAPKTNASEVVMNVPNLVELQEALRTADTEMSPKNNLHISQGETIQDENVGIHDPIQSTSKNQFDQDLSSDVHRRQECVATVQTSVPCLETNINILNTKLEMPAKPDNHSASVSSTSEIENDLHISVSKIELTESQIEDVVPSAPLLEERFQPQAPYEEVIEESKPKIQCMAIEQAVKAYGGAEMAAVRSMSEKEELIVEAGAVSGPEHPLVDLLSTFRSSLRALDNERAKLLTGFHEEEKSRSSLWLVEKRCISKQIECKCKTMVTLNATYEHATYLKDRVPVARLRLESLLRDVQDSYCHHQHSALLAHCQVEEFISETLNSNKPVIREALSLVLQALRMSDSALLAAALRRWAAALVAALVDQRDIQQILFVIHHLFRQSRSVVWAARVLHPGVGSPTTLAVLDTLLAGVSRDAATECFEDMEEAWEEVSAGGGSGAVAEDALRERDLLALLYVFPLRDIVAKIVLMPHTDIHKAATHAWGDTRGGRDVIAACCGVRTLLLTLKRAIAAHPKYLKLHSRLRTIAVAVLEALACLYQCPRVPYEASLQDSILAELEACFTAAFSLFGTRDLDKLTAALLTQDAVRDYCLTFIVGLHDKSPKRMESLSIEAPVLSCSQRVRIVTHAAASRTHDHELAAVVLDFLLQTGVKNKSPICSSGCSSEARTCLPRLLAAHEYLRTTALYSLAETAKVESLDPSVVSTLEVKHWRPLPDEAINLLNDWSQRCPALVPELLMQLDCTPFSGVSHATQLAILRFVCGWAGPVEARWRVIRRLRTHAVWWGGAVACLPAPEAPPTDAFDNAFVLLATEWGHSIPLICSHGVGALLSLSALRTQEAVHCLAPIMLIMAHSPESIAFTPEFGEVFSSLASSGPTLVQRALGRGGVSGSELLLKLALTQLEQQPAGSDYRRGVVWAWLHALGGAAADALAAAHRDWPAMDRHAELLLQDKNAKEHIANAVRNASTAPLLCECMLRACYTHHEHNTRMFGSIANILWQQHINGHRIHVDNALQKLNISSSSEELVIYRSASAALVAPLRHPAHLTLWRLFLHLYLQRPPDNMHEAAVPVGPLFFSGLKKSRTISQIKKRLQETIIYHRNKAEMYTKTNSYGSQPESSSVERSDSKNLEQSLLPELSIRDFTGESEDDSDVDSSDDEVEAKVVGTDEARTINYVLYMAMYHTDAERMLEEYLTWLEAGDRVRASHHHADIARFIPEKELEQAWQDYVKSIRPASSDMDEFPLPAPPPAPPPPPPSDHSPSAEAVNAIMKIKDKSGIKSRRSIQSPLGEVQFEDTRRLLSVIDNHLDDIDRLTKEWCGEVSRVSSLDAEVWRLTSALRVPRPLPPLARLCNNRERKCKPVTFHFDEREWCISTGAERGIKENRSSWRAAVRRLARPRPGAVRTAAALHSIARRVRDSGAAACAVERAFARAEGACPAARAARAAFVDELAQRWISNNGRLCADLLSRWCSKHTDKTDHSLCGYLVTPHRVDKADWPLIYNVLLDARIPSHTLFSYLSKFDMPSWSKTASPEARHKLLSSILTTYIRLGPVPSDHEAVLLELLAVHTTAVLDAREMCWLVWRLAQTSAEGVLPPLIWTHVVRAVEAIAGDVAFDDLGHLLRQLGEVWWEARVAARSTPVPPAVYAPHVASLLRALLRAFVAAAVTLSYHPVRVGACAWPAAQQAWEPWVCPHPSTPPLLPSLATDGSHHSAMLDQFVMSLQLIIDICPESAWSVLPAVFLWGAAAQGRAQAGAEARVQASELLAALARLPWDRPWLTHAAIDAALQIYGTTDKEVQSWCTLLLRDVTAPHMLCDVTADHVAARLASLLYLLTATDTHYPQVVEQATLLPWWQLPEEPLAAAVEAFFRAHYNCTTPYHELPSFRVILYASELCLHTHALSNSSMSVSKRALVISAWASAASAPSSHAHVTAHVAAMLDIINNIAACVEARELDVVLGRGTVILCVEPAAAAAVTVWVQWVGATSGAVCAASVSASAALTSAAHAPTLADAAVRRHLHVNESGWVEVSSRWSSSSWQDAHVFSRRSCLHAAYACVLAHTHRFNTTLFTSLMDVNINFVEEEAIVAVWICYACRVALECSATSAAHATCATSAVDEMRHAACSLLGRWARAPRLNILRVVTLHPDTDHTTAHHRALCRLAECIISPSPESAHNYSAALTSLGANIADIADIASWGTRAEPKLLPRLAGRFYPKHERYFVVELYNASGKT